MNNSYATLIGHQSNINNVQRLARKPDPGHGSKRKRDDPADTPSPRPDIHLSQGSSAHPGMLLRPLATVSRSQFPLSFLDASSSIHQRFHSSSLLCDSPRQDQILIIVRAADGALYAIEPVVGSEYVLCRVASHVSLPDIMAIRPEPMSPLTMAVVAQANWWAGAAVQIPPSGAQDSPRKAPRLSMLLEKATDQKQAQGSPLVPIARDTVPDDPAQDNLPIGRDEACAQFIRQYLDMLYKTQTSVAYFAKAHTARLRAALHPDDDPGKAQDMIGFLSGMILTSATFDKKYKTLWPARVNDLGPVCPIEGDGGDGTVETKKRKAKLKLKLNKQGLLPDEDESFSHWWYHGEEMPRSGETLDSRFKRRALALRTREAFLQIILILEVMMLQDSLKDTSEKNATADAAATTAPESTATGKSFDTVLELLLDKLCIWHSLDFGGADDKALETGAAKRAAPNHLREFCVDVVVPFYMPKLPARANAINQKFGGPNTQKAEKQKSGRTKDDQKRSSMSRTTSTNDGEKIRPSKPNTTRSVTDPQPLVTFKRESSEASVRLADLQFERKSDLRRSSSVAQTNLRSREVDFNAMSQAQEKRRQRQAEVDAKLKEAIGGLRKPNRVVVGKELAEVSEQREIMARARERAAKDKRARQRAAHTQVDATPTANRIRPDLLTARTPEARGSVDKLHPASASRVPSSGAKLFPRDHEEAEDVPQTGRRERYRHVVDVDDGPGARFAVPTAPGRSGRGGGEAHVFETPVKARSAFETPVKARAVFDAAGVEATPVRGLDAGCVLRTPVQQQPGKSALAGGQEQESAPTREEGGGRGDDIYAALGWE